MIWGSHSPDSPDSLDNLEHLRCPFSCPHQVSKRSSWLLECARSRCSAGQLLARLPVLFLLQMWGRMGGRTLGNRGKSVGSVALSSRGLISEKGSRNCTLPSSRAWSREVGVGWGELHPLPGKAVKPSALKVPAGHFDFVKVHVLLSSCTLIPRLWVLMYEKMQSKLRPLLASILQLELDNHGLLVSSRALKFQYG